ncbi:MAG: uridine phosphorylase [Armatimonadota bacterium]
MTPDDPQYHIQCRRGDVGRYVLLPGDPGRCIRIARHFDNARLVVQNREYTTYTGTLLGESVSVTSTGIGCPSTAIAVEELVAIGADTLIRVGTAGGMSRDVQPGDVVVALAAIRDEGTSHQYMPPAFPAVADLDVVWALREAARGEGVRHHVGVIHSKDSFYGEWEPERMPVAGLLTANWRAWIAGGALCSEMEAATLFVVARIQGVRAGGIMGVGSNQELGLRGTSEGRLQAQETAIQVAIAALRRLIMIDRGG